MRRNTMWTALPLVLAIASPLVAGQERRGRPTEITVHPGALAVLIDELGGHQVRLPRSRVIAVLNPRAFLVESASPLPASKGHFNRLLVLVEPGALSQDAASIVGSTVIVLGVARTLLGLQVTREVPWPPELTRKVLERYDIRAGVLASSIRTSDGVELITRRLPVGDSE